MKLETKKLREKDFECNLTHDLFVLKWLFVLLGTISKNYIFN